MTRITREMAAEWQRGKATDDGGSTMSRDDPLALAAAYVALDRRLRELLAERMKHGATDEIDRRLAVLIEEQRRRARAGWFS